MNKPSQMRHYFVAGMAAAAACTALLLACTSTTPKSEILGPEGPTRSVIVQGTDLETCLLKRQPTDRRPVPQVLAAGDLRNHTPVRTMRLELTRDHGGEDPPLAVENRTSRIVTRALDAEYERGRMGHRDDSGMPRR